MILCGTRDQSYGQQAMVLPSRQGSNTFLTLDSDSFGEKPDFEGEFCSARGMVFFFCLPSTNTVERQEKIHTCI